VTKALGVKLHASVWTRKIFGWLKVAEQQALIIMKNEFVLSAQSV
jgi:hypothetical protein